MSVHEVELTLNIHCAPHSAEHPLAVQLHKYRFDLLGNLESRTMSVTNIFSTQDTYHDQCQNHAEIPCTHQVPVLSPCCLLVTGCATHLSGFGCCGANRV